MCALGHRGRGAGRIGALALRFSFLAAVLAAPAGLAAVAGLSPTANVLILWDGAANLNLVTGALALLVPPPTVTACEVSQSGNGGIYAALTTCGQTLSNFCQVWDLRFNTTSPQPAGNVAWDTFTLASSGPNSDEALYDAFLSGGGSLFIQTDNSDFVSRNANLTQWLTQDLSTAGPILYPSKTGAANVAFNIFPADPLGFATTPNAMATVCAGYGVNTTEPGWLTAGGIGSFIPLVENSSGDIQTMGLLPSASKLGVGQVIVSYDWNSLTNAWNWGTSGCTNAPYVQNLYEWLGNCQEHYGVSKTASVLPPATVCIGQDFNYYLCVTNYGLNPIASAFLGDTLSTCVTYVSSSLPPTQSGHYLSWNIASLPANSTVCVTVTVQASSLPPCP